jgi:hypothetical protein
MERTCNCWRASWYQRRVGEALEKAQTRQETEAERAEQREEVAERRYEMEDCAASVAAAVIVCAY